MICKLHFVDNVYKHAKVHSFADSEIVLSIAMNHNSFKDQSFIYIKLNDQIVLFQTIQFSICLYAVKCHFFAHS